MTEDEKLLKLREYYGSRTDDVARKVLDSFASKTNWRKWSLVHRIAQETQLSENKIRAFLKDKLEDELDLGKYRKGAQGYKSRFIWNVDAGYSLVSVGLAAQGKATSLFGNVDEVVTEEEEEGEIVEETVKIGRDRLFKAEFPNDLTEKEFEHFVSSFKIIYFRS